MNPPRTRADDDERRILGTSYTADDTALFKDIAEAAAEATVIRMFVTMGLDPKQPLDSQRDFQVLRNLAKKGASEEDAADAAWVRRWRERTEGVAGKIMAGVVALLLASGAHVAWVGFKALVK